MSTKNLAKVNGITIQVIEENSVKLIPIKPICEALGIDESAQRKKLQEDEFLNSTAVLSAAVGADGKQREMVCLPLEFIFGWLFTINPKNVKPEAQEAVSRYRIECYRALFHHFALQSEFLSQKQEKIEKAIETYQRIQAEFRTAKNRMEDAKNELDRIRKITFEEWQTENAQLKLF
jgi:ribosomal protein S13/FtsZ-binding cell division protein ZapB